MTTNRILLLVVGGLLLAGVALQLAPRAGRGYIAESMIVAKPYTNVFFTASFESHVVITIPGILRVQVTPSFATIPSSGIPGVTNGVGIRVFAYGRTPGEAEEVANEAAASLREMVTTNYGMKGIIVQTATGASRYSYFHDTLQPALGRLFNP